jgi:hypothetical protein
MAQMLVCIAPHQVAEEDYLATVYEDSRPEFAQHMQQCDYCRAEIETYRALETGLSRMLVFQQADARQNCPPSQALGEFALKMLAQPEMHRLEAHVAGCPFCRTEVTELAEWLAEPDAATQQVPQTQSQATQPKPQPSTQSGEKLDWLRKVIAHLVKVGDTLTNPQPGYALAGVRGDMDGLPLTYQAEEILVTVTVQPIAPHKPERMVIGLVQREDATMDAAMGARVRLYAGATALATETIDELGNFMFEEVTPAERQQLDLEITLSDRIVLVPNLPLN